MATEMATATVMRATVWMLSSHRPMAPKYSTPTAVSSPARRPSTAAATMAVAPVTTYHGSQSRMRSTARRAQSITSLTGLKKKEKLQWVVWLLITQRRALSIQSASPMVQESGKPSTEPSASWAATIAATPTTSPPPERSRLRRSRASRASTSLAIGDAAVAGAVAVTVGRWTRRSRASCCWSFRPIWRPPAHGPPHRPPRPARWLRTPRPGWPAAGAVCRREPC